jgi:MFS transporter, PPP family, 3-phenylpropionic acid transporter
MRKIALPVLFSGTMYFGYYLGLGAYTPFINLYYERLGLTALQIGTLSALAVLVFSATALIWSTLADTFHLHKQILTISLLLTPLAVLLIPRAPGFTNLVPIIFLYALCGSAIVPLMDSLSLDVAKNHGSNYGRLRVWGSIGWSVSTFLIGSIIERTDIRLFFYIFAGVLGLLFLLSFFQPNRTSLRKSSSSGSFRQFLRLDLAIFLISMYMLSISSGAVLTFFSIYLDRIGAGEALIGASWAVSALSEIPVMIFSVVIMRYIGANGLLRIAFLAYAVRWFAFAFITDPHLALAMQLLHGLSFGSFLIGSVTYMNERAPTGMTTTAQALLSTVTFGLGTITGSLSGGYLLDRVGMSNLFLIMGGVAVAGLLLFILVPLIQPPCPSQHSPSGIS